MSFYTFHQVRDLAQKLLFQMGCHRFSLGAHSSGQLPTSQSLAEALCYRLSHVSHFIDGRCPACDLTILIRDGFVHFDATYPYICHRCHLSLQDHGIELDIIVRRDLWGD